VFFSYLFLAVIQYRTCSSDQGESCCNGSRCLMEGDRVVNKHHGSYFSYTCMSTALIRVPSNYFCELCSVGVRGWVRVRVATMVIAGTHIEVVFHSTDVGVNCWVSMHAAQESGVCAVDRKHCLYRMMMAALMPVGIYIGYTNHHATTKWGHRPTQAGQRLTVIRCERLMHKGLGLMCAVALHTWRGGCLCCIANAARV
jgi:hypothetical protein